VVESLDSALARIDPLDLLWLVGGIFFVVFVVVMLVSLAATRVRNRRRIERDSTEQRPTILKTSPPLAPLPPQRRHQHERHHGH
jgi:hypothetical protein